MYSQKKIVNKLFICGNMDVNIIKKLEIKMASVIIDQVSNDKIYC